MASITVDLSREPAYLPAQGKVDGTHMTPG